jgi:hypothetical protein
MTETTPPPPSATGLPAPTAPSTSKSPWRVIGPIVAIIVVIGGYVIFKGVIPAMADNKYKVGACLDTIPTSTTSQTLDTKPKVVDCTDSAAKSKIIAAIEGKTLDDAATACPSDWQAAISFKASSIITKDKLLCLVEV